MESIARFAGVDWASRRHAICIVDERGEPLERFEVEHTEPGLRTLARRLAKAGVTRVAIERPDGPVIDALFAAGLEVVVIASRHVKALRTRLGRPATRTTAPTHTCSPMSCGPTTIASARCARTVPRRSPCGRRSGLARTSSRRERG